MDKKSFRITGGKGFHISFPNGYTVSVQFGPGNYADNYDAQFGDDDMRGEYESNTAECAVWTGNGDMIEKFGDEEYRSTVSNRSRIVEVMELLNWAASQPDSTVQRSGDANE